MLNTTWVWGKNETIGFRPRGRIFWKGEERKDFQWKVGDEKQRIVEGETPSHHSFRILFQEDLLTGTVVTDGGSRPTRVVLK